MELFLVDANVIIDAREGNQSAGRILQSAESGDIILEAPPSITNEVGGKLPDAVDEWRPPEQIPVSAGRRMEELESFIEKEYGGPGGSRKEPSEADKALVKAAVKDPMVQGIITSDTGDIEHLMYQLDQGDRVDIYAPEEIANRYT